MSMNHVCKLIFVSHSLQIKFEDCVTKPGMCKWQLEAVKFLCKPKHFEKRR